MKHLTINIPDYYYQTFMEYFKHIPDATLLNESSFILDEKQIALLDQRAKTPDREYISIEESNRRLKNRL
jgi:hypothetical protein